MSDKRTLILLIEDNPDHAFYIEKGLSNRGFQVIWYANGADGLRAARTEKPAVILLDVMLPHTHGLDLLRELKRDAQTVSIPVIVVTAYATLQLNREKEMAMSYGAVDFLKKPFKVGELAEKLHALIDEQEA
ncbi:MAG: response regulator transcription factor [Candidatus Lernaella stagnicola]|nr:response regulator transcription factor [Candidatus Lernaella stagnicola]